MLRLFVFQLLRKNLVLKLDEMTFHFCQLKFSILLYLHALFWDVVYKFKVDFIVRVLHFSSNTFLAFRAKIFSQKFVICIHIDLDFFKINLFHRPRIISICDASIDWLSPPSTTVYHAIAASDQVGSLKTFSPRFFILVFDHLTNFFLNSGPISHLYVLEIAIISLL